MTRESQDASHPLMLVTEFAGLMRVNPKTVHRWIREGLLPDAGLLRTPGKQYRIRRECARAIMNGEIAGIDPQHLEDTAKVSG